MVIDYLNFMHFCAHNVTKKFLCIQTLLHSIYVSNGLKGKEAEPFKENTLHQNPSFH